MRLTGRDGATVVVKSLSAEGIRPKRLRELVAGQGRGSWLSATVCPKVQPTKQKPQPEKSPEE